MVYTSMYIFLDHHTDGILDSSLAVFFCRGARTRLLMKNNDVQNGPFLIKYDARSGIIIITSIISIIIEKEPFSMDIVYTKEE